MLAFLVCGLTLLFTPNASSLKCQSCGPGDAPCDGPNVTSINCEAFADSCMTVTMMMNHTIGGPQTFIMKNCSHSTIICQEDGPRYPCKQALPSNETTCRVNCCEGDMCNQESSGVVTPTATVTMPAASSNVSTNVSLSSNTTTPTPEDNEPPSAGVPEFSAVFSSIFLGFMVAFLATLS
ncbi:unnamed protein product [Porites evermanni]|uniref:Uncharacterized protein n=1 Tax=Porites evermanni TaxID=104178 RepID=A0ABN8MKG6_9CNID|nr:unnamed protein product [Porites evermanni]